MEELSQETEKKPWQGKLLFWLQLVILMLASGMVVLIGIFGYAGYKGGEMGTMIGIFSTIGLIFLLPLLILDVFVVVHIFKGKKWAVIVALIFTILGFPSVFFSISGGVFSFLPVLILYVLNLWMEIKCLKLPYFNRK